MSVWLILLRQSVSNKQSHFNRMQLNLAFVPPFLTKTEVNVHVCANSDSAGQHFEQSLNTYKNLADSQDPAFLTVQDDFCRFLLFSGQQEVLNAHSHNVETQTQAYV